MVGEKSLGVFIGENGAVDWDGVEKWQGKGSYDVLQTKFSERKALNIGEGGKNYGWMQLNEYILQD